MWTAAILGLGTMAVAMAGLWAIHLKTANAGVVDVGWSLGVPWCAALFAAFGPGWPLRRLVVAAMVAVWGLRLGAHIIGRLRREGEDPRYAQLRKGWTGNVQLKFLGFFELQALLALVFALPVAVASRNPAPGFSALEYLGLVLWSIAVVGESAADIQLREFKKANPGHGKVCDVGLWRYSRHPNYFFEFLLWVALAVFASASPWGGSAVVCPLLMLFFLFKVTGIPATEAQALRSKGEAYRRYQRTTSAFVPWFPMKESG
ncbi:MAG TPA: DUF1295 domain-containing protein [Gammaproteobacteria bacterium]|nr:DUF1295 domain-containing protein [Gammaproteobacteria bacterium]